MKQFYNNVTEFWLKFEKKKKKKKMKSLTKPTVHDKALKYGRVSKRSDPNFSICVKIKTDDHIS